MLADGPTTDRPEIPPAALGLIEDINHRVIDEYAEAIAMLSRAAGRAEPGVKDALFSAAGRLRDHAAAHRALLPPVAGGQVSLGRHVEAICASFTKAALAGRGIHLLLKTDDILLSADRCWRIGLVIAELVRGAMRHGLSGKPGSIEVRVTGDRGRITCLVSDSGSGAPGRSPPGRGQRLVRTLVADMGGAVRWSFTPRGSFALARVPTASPPKAPSFGHRRADAAESRC